MGVASLVLGIISLIVAFIPCCQMVAILPAIIGLILGIVEVVKKSKSQEPKGMGIAGLVLSAISIVVIILYCFVWGAAFTGALTDSVNYLNTYSDYYNNYNSSYNSSYYNY